MRLADLFLSLPFVESAEVGPTSPKEEFAAKGQLELAASGDQESELWGDSRTIFSFWKFRRTLLIEET